MLRRDCRTINKIILLIILITAINVAAAKGSQKAENINTRTQEGRLLYETACAACHGMAGTGAARESVGFETALPNFSDCGFAQREPNSDWYAIVHNGGPARGFNQIMPAFGEALSEEEIQKVLIYVRSLCHNKAWPRGELNLPRALITEKAFPEDEAILTTTVDTDSPGAVLNKLVYEQRFGARNQLEIALPIEAHEGVGGGWSGGIGDIAIGVKRVLFASLESGTIFSVTGEAVLPTGDEDKGLGKGVTVIEPFVTFGQFLPADGFIQFQGGFEFPVDHDRGANEAFWRVAVGRSFTQKNFGRTWSPMVEILGAQELESGSKAHWDLVPQLQVTLSKRQHIMLNGGVRFPVDDTESRPTQIIVYLLWDWFDGGFLEGW